MNILEELRSQCSKQQKRGIHFILASVIIWIAIFTVQMSNMPILTKNLLTFCCAAPLMPLAYVISRFLEIKFSNKSNKLNELGIIFSMNQMLYLLIAMWVYTAVPEKLVMVIAIIFGAHLLPYGWLYKSRTYNVMSVIIPILSLYVGCRYSRVTLALMMIVIEITFSICLIIENRVKE
ncbi:MAG: hypothetical protein IJH34_02460 [Romboutsia sp.]|nr:hypothetical protein [Romboutsia sp.]